MSAASPPLISRLRQSAAFWLQGLWCEPLRLHLLNPLHAGLWVASGGYRLGLGVDQWLKRRKQRKLSVCVVSIGNLVVGGTGKTPFTLWLAETLATAGIGVAILSRGYGRRDDRIVQAPRTTTAWEDAASLYGDEPLLLARRLPGIPVWVGQNRYAAGQMALEGDNRPSVLILDDGFQHVSLHRDIDIVLLDAERPFGNGRLLPMGPLREPVRNLARAHALVLTRAGDKTVSSEGRATLMKSFPEKPVFACRHRMTGIAPSIGEPTIGSAELHNKVCVAFAGIAMPQSFFESLRAVDPSLRVAETLSFPDHHAFTEADCAQLVERRRRCGADFLVTTEKDWVRLPRSLQSHVFAAALTLDFGEDLALLITYLLHHIDRHRVRS